MMNHPVPNQPQHNQQQCQQLRNQRESYTKSVQQPSIEYTSIQSYRPPSVAQSSFLMSSPLMNTNAATTNPLLHHDCHTGKATPAGGTKHNASLTPQPKAIQYVTNPSDGSILRDHNNKPITIDKLLATQPLKHELLKRDGPGGKKLTYMSGDWISRSLNDIFGFDGWNLDIIHVQRVETINHREKYTVIYTAQVRLTHKASGAYKEDVGTGDSMDRSLATAVGHAIKASITDAMKRAARHFGEKLGNALYKDKFSINNAPRTLQEALDRYDINRANTKFGFPKDRAAREQANSSAIHGTSASIMGRNFAPKIGSDEQTRNDTCGENGGNFAPKAIKNNHQTPSHGNRAPLANLSGNTADTRTNSVQQQRFNQVRSNASNSTTYNSNSKPNPYQPPTRKAVPSAFTTGQNFRIAAQSTMANSNACTNNNTLNRDTVGAVVSKEKNSYSSETKQRPKSRQPKANLPTASHISSDKTMANNNLIGPPPTSTDALRKSTLFSHPSQQSVQPVPFLDTVEYNNIPGSDPPSRRGRLSMGGQNPIQPQQASLITPSNTVKRPYNAPDQRGNIKRLCRPNNPYATH